MKTKLLLCICLFIICSCANNEYERQAWEVAENSVINRKELLCFLEHYKSKNDKEKYEASCFLISNLIGKYSKGASNIYDIDVLTSDSLIYSVEESFLLWKECPYLHKYSFKQFLEYILPYRVAEEPLEFYWKTDCKRRFAVENMSDIIEAAKLINSKVKLEQSPASYGDMPQSYSSLIKNGYGKCNDRTTLVVMALRAVGIPAAYEFVPYWGSNNNGHSFASIILPDGKIYPLPNTNELTNDDYLARKTPKVYRKMYRLQSQLSQNSNIPELFQYNDVLDVTELHKIDVSNVEISSEQGTKKNLYYLSVFSPNSWIPVALSNSMKFINIGTGTMSASGDNKEAIDLGDGIVYLPIQWVDGEAVPVSNPIIVSNHSVNEIVADTVNREKVVLKRKFPLNTRIIDFARLMIQGVFEGANKSDFSDAQEIYRITTIPESQIQRINLSLDKSYRYVRYRRSKGTFSIAEFCIYQADGVSISFQPIACEPIQQDSTMINAFDANPLTYYQVSGGIDLWIGADLHKPLKIGAIGFAPRNDDNAVNSTDIYELFYWKDKWISLGINKTKNNNIVYEDVPKNSLLWLRNLSKGSEERPFKYENGKQIWW